MFVIYLLVIIVFCKITSGEYSLFLWWFRHWSKCSVIHMGLFWSNRGFNRRLQCYLR